jgi:hypothetical protein
MDDSTPGRKTSDADVEKRIDRIIELIGSGITMRKILLKLFVKETNLTPSQFDKDFKKAKNRILKLNKPKQEQHIAEAIFRLQLLFNKNYKMQDYRECRNIQAELNKLLGLYKPMQLQVDQKLDNQITITVQSEEDKDNIAKI